MSASNTSALAADLPHRIAELARERPREPAIIEVSGRSISWSELHEGAVRWATALQQVGVKDGQTVATMLPTRIDAHLVWLGTAWLRAIEAPANTMFRGDMLRYVVNYCEAEVLVISDQYVDRLLSIADELASLKVVIIVGDGGHPQLPWNTVTSKALLAGVTPPRDLPGPARWDVAAMIYTSGTTGPSKGVLVPWGELQQFAAALPEGFLVEGEPYYSGYPTYHVSGKAALVFAVYASTHTVIREAWSVSEFWDDVRRFKVRSAGLLGPIGAMLMANPARPDDADNPLEQVVMGPIVANVEEFQRRFGVERIATGYGMTEIGFPLASPWGPPNSRTCGRRREGSPGYEVRIVDEHDLPVAPGEVGELIVRAREPWVMNAGYWRMPDKTAEAWRNGWFHTGDAFSEDEDGWLYFVDRIKDALRRRGENISSFEVEAGILQHPAVAECAVIGVPSELGEDDVKAVIVAKPGDSVKAEELIDFLAPRMPRFMIPRYIEFVDALPKTDATFRVRKVELRSAGVNERTWDREAARLAPPTK